MDINDELHGGAAEYARACEPPVKRKKRGAMSRAAKLVAAGAAIGTAALMASVRVSVVIESVGVNSASASVSVSAIGAAEAGEMTYTLVEACDPGGEADEPVCSGAAADGSLLELRPLKAATSYRLDILRRAPGAEAPVRAASRVFTTREQSAPQADDSEQGSAAAQGNEAAH